MTYIRGFTFPNADKEHNFFMKTLRTCYDSYYPFQVLSAAGLEHVDFEPVTIFCGENGSGKSTALNVIAEKAEVKRDSVFNKSNFYPDYLKLCTMDKDSDTPTDAKIITSDDVFDYMLNIRNLNEGIDLKREEMFAEYLDVKYTQFQLKSISDYEHLQKMNKARSKTQSRYVRGELISNVREYSNGESAYRYFVDKIGENGLYLLDEPENSLSPERQTELAGLIEDSARFFGCQFIISTHSLFLLALRGARIYDLDENPVKVKRWTELGNVRAYYEFFQSHARDFRGK